MPQPFVNPNYFSYLNPSMNYAMPNNPYQAGMQNVPSVPSMQSVQSPSTTMNLVGRCVNDFNEITVNDVPMNGIAVFPKADRSEIQIREWSSNGQIVTTPYKAVVETKEDNTANVPEVQSFKFDVKTEVLDPIFDKLSELEQQVAKLSKSSTATNSRAKKDGEQA